DLVGLALNGGAAQVRASRIVNNAGGGIVVDGGGTLVLENSFVGGDQNDQRAIDVLDGSASVLYSTLAGGFGTAAALVCADGTNVSVRNSLLVARTADDEVSCADATVTDNALEMDVEGNTSLGEMSGTDWFVNYAGG